MNDLNSDDRERETSRRFVERLAERYRPEPLGPAQQARFDASLRERIERRRRLAPAWIPALAGAATGLVLGWWAWPAAPPVPHAGVELAAIETSTAPAPGWGADLLLVDTDPGLAEEEYLPDEYVAIALAFLDGV